MSNEDILHPLLQHMFNMASLYMDTSCEMLSPFINCLTDNCLLYARLDCTQTLLRLFLQMFQRSFKAIFFWFFVANSFTYLLTPKALSLYRLLKINYGSLCTDSIPWETSSAVNHFYGNKVSWYPVLSKLVSYLSEVWGLFVDSTY